jgi:hypothetical protein
MHPVMVPMPKNFVVNIGKETKKLALVKAGQLQERLGRRVTIEQTVKVALELLDVQAAALRLIKDEEVEEK